jgi:Transaldolase/Fructose-6-phosphate aldolase
MNPTQALHQLGQSLGLDNITRALLTSGTLARYIRDLSVTGLTSNPSIFEQAISAGDDYDASIAVLADLGMSDEDLFFELALEDLTAAPTCSARFSTQPTALTAGSRLRFRRCWRTTPRTPCGPQTD